MDYCSTCRRTLNGVFVCPGCGAYAPDIAPPAHLLRSAVASVATTHELGRAEGAFAPGAPGAVGATGAADASGAVESADVQAADVQGAALTGQGRAARRRQRARWKKHQRRALAATAVALVGGGLTVAAMPSTRPSTAQAHAAPPLEPVTTPATPKAPAAAGTRERPDGPAPEQPGTPPRTTGRVQHATVALPATPPANRQPRSVALTTAEAPAPRSAPPRTAPVSAPRTDARTPDTIPTDAATPSAPGTTTRTGAEPDAGAPDVPETTTPPRTEERPADTGTSLLGGLVSTAPATDPASPTGVCLVGLCLG